jgi:hypothetical protein
MAQTRIRPTKTEVLRHTNTGVRSPEWQLCASAQRTLQGADKQSLFITVGESGGDPHLVALSGIKPLTFHRSDSTLGHGLGANLEGLGGA